MGKSLIALDIKTCRKLSGSRCSGFTIGSYAGYFRDPHRKRPGCSRPYADFAEHWIVGFIYEFAEAAPSADMVLITDVIVQPKWRIASRSSGTGTTKHIGAVRHIERLGEGQGDFESEQDFGRYWRDYGG